MPLFQGGGNIIPSGSILLWHGSIASIPTGWVLCDGTHSTPDLRGRFIVGAGTGGSVGDYAVDATADNPTHNHNFGAGSVLDAGSDIDAQVLGGNYAITASVSGSTGDNNSASKPPYYALAYIMKT